MDTNSNDDSRTPPRYSTSEIAAPAAAASSAVAAASAAAATNRVVSASSRAASSSSSAPSYASSGAQNTWASRGSGGDSSSSNIPPRRGADPARITTSVGRYVAIRSSRASPATAPLAAAASSSPVGAAAAAAAATAALLSQSERRALLQQHLPQEMVDAYCGDAGSSFSSSPFAAARIPHDDLVDALRVVPHLVARESPYQLYIIEAANVGTGESTTASAAAAAAPSIGSNTSTSNATTTDPQVARLAAFKLARYWQLRRQYFEDRWYLPMVLTHVGHRSSASTSPRGSAATTTDAGAGGRSRSSPKDIGLRRSSTTSTDASDDAAARGGGGRNRKAASAPVAVGALSEHDMEVLRTGAVVLLPTTADPAKGRNILVLDRSRLLPHHWNSPPYQKSMTRIAFYFLALASRTNQVSQTRGIVIFQFQSSISGMILTTKRRGYPVTLTREAFPIKHADFHVVFLPSKINVFLPILYTAFQNFLNAVGSNVVEPFSTLVVHTGLSDENVLHKLAESGNFNRADFPQWCLGGTGNYTMETFRDWQVQQYQREEDDWMTEEQKQDKRRSINAQRSREKRDRAKARFEYLENEVYSVKAENRSLKKEHARLEKLLLHARLTVSVMDRLGTASTERDESEADDPQRPVVPATGGGAAAAGKTEVEPSTEEGRVGRAVRREGRPKQDAHYDDHPHDDGHDQEDGQDRGHEEEDQNDDREEDQEEDRSETLHRKSKKPRPA